MFKHVLSLLMWGMVLVACGSDSPVLLDDGNDLGLDLDSVDQASDGSDVIDAQADDGLVTASCGNTVCEEGETCTSCEADCGACSASCGNSVCEEGETSKQDFTRAGYGTWTVGAGQVQNGGKLSDHLGLRTRIGHLR